MESTRAEIQQLRALLDALVNKQTTLHANVDALSVEIAAIQTRINTLTEAVLLEPLTDPVIEIEPNEQIEEKIAAPIQEITEVNGPLDETTQLVDSHKKTDQIIPSTPKEKSSFESFLGENLANKIGIAIILIGIGVGVKYAIDKNMLGPAMRIACGYLAGAILIGFALYLKKKYENLSAVMFAGGMAVAYFVTFIAHDFYHLLPKMVTFGTMLIFTVITSLAAIRYNKQVIAIVGLVGAYAVPFLLSDGSGSTSDLLIYITIINSGILYLSFRKAWQPVFTVTFGCTWFIFFIVFTRAMWLQPQDFKTLLLFGSIFYALFYATFIVYKHKHREQLGNGDSSVLIVNTILAYAFGISLVNEIFDEDFINGMYTLIFAASQGLVTIISHKQKEMDHRLYYLSFGFALIFATIAVPLLFDGNWITILWSLQSVLFFWIGRKKADQFFEHISFIPIFLALFSLFISWKNMHSGVYYYENPILVTTVFNWYFLAGIILTGALFYMSYLKQATESENDRLDSVGFFQFLGNSLAYLGVVVLYLVIIKEIDIYWDQKSALTDDKSGYLFDFFSSSKHLKSTWIILFTLLYLGVIQLGNRFVLKHKMLSVATGIASFVAALVFLTIGLSTISVLRDRALAGTYGAGLTEYTFTFTIRYIGYLALAFTLVANHFTLRRIVPSRLFRQGLEIFIHICLVWVVCAELIHLKKMNVGGDLYRAGLTIFGGMYSFFLIGFGIWKKKPHLRLLALILFGITLIKLFIYDIANVNSGGKTIAFISLGVLLLVISFLYTKYKHLILPSEEEKTDETYSE